MFDERFKEKKVHFYHRGVKVYLNYLKEVESGEEGDFEFFIDGEDFYSGWMYWDNSDGVSSRIEITQAIKKAIEKRLKEVEEIKQLSNRLNKS